MHNRRDSLGKIGEDKPTHDEKTINIPVAAAEQQIYIYILHLEITVVKFCKLY